MKTNSEFWDLKVSDKYEKKVPLVQSCKINRIKKNMTFETKQIWKL